MYICVCRCRQATVDKQLWGDLANKNGPELTSKTVAMVQLMMSVVMYMFVYVCVILVLLRLKISYISPILPFFGGKTNFFQRLLIYSLFQLL